MTEDKIIDYSRQGNVNRAFAFVAVLVTAAGIVLNYMNPVGYTELVVFVGMPVVLFFISLGMGGGSKKAID